MRKPSRHGRSAGAVLSSCLAVAATLVVTAPDEVQREPIESIHRSGPSNGDAPPALLAAGSSTAVLVHETPDGSVTFSFVDKDNEQIAQWSSHRRASTRLVCVACPTPLVGDRSGYYAWDGSSWKLVELPARRSSLADPLTATFGILTTSGVRTSVALLPGEDGNYLLVRDGGSKISTVPTAIRPASGEQVDLEGGPGRTHAPTALLREPDGAVVSLQSDIMDPDATSILAVTRNGRTDKVTLAGGHGVPTSNSAPCVRLVEGAPRAVLVSTQPLVVNTEPTHPPEAAEQFAPNVSVVWVSDDLEEQRRVELRGFYDECAVFADGTVHLWTGVTAGFAAVDVASVDPTGVVRTDTVTVTEGDTLVNTLLRRDDPSGTLLAWPLGKRGMVIDSTFAVRPGRGLGGNQVLQDDEGGVWGWFSYVRAVARLGPTEVVP
ncbi:MAG: hypothetical protein KatS3mg008_1734 [Acidimicrobiales bacterium]|nr:MAG: hypothetical protein KatS3mg008_1734 [Acidimicrobiales bacterium]